MGAGKYDTGVFINYAPNSLLGFELSYSDLT